MTFRIAASAARRRGAMAGLLAALVGSGFLLLVLALQFVRGDLAWVDAQLSLYLHGPYGLLLRSAYCVLALSMVALAVGLQRALAAAARSATVLGLFCAAGIGLASVAIGDSWLPQLAPAFALPVHLVSAQAAFLCVIAAVLLQSWYFRRDPAWQRHAVLARMLAVAAFIVLAWHVGVSGAPRGLSQKLAIVLIVAWLIVTGWRLWRPVVAGAAPQPASRDNGALQPEEA